MVGGPSLNKFITQVAALFDELFVTVAHRKRASTDADTLFWTKPQKRFPRNGAFTTNNVKCRNTSSERRSKPVLVMCQQ